MSTVYDKNMVVAEEQLDDKYTWYDVRKASVDVYGFDHEGEELLSQRIPCKIAENVSQGVFHQSGFAAGGRVRFWTDSMSIAIQVEFANGNHPTCLCACAAHGLDLYLADENGRETFLHAFRPTKNDMHHQTLQSSVNMREALVRMGETNGAFLTLNLPLFMEVKKLYIGLEKGSQLSYGKKYRNDKPVIFYGSSITHGAAASRPGNTYEAFISQKYNLNYVNLGFAGNAKGECEMAKYIADRDMQVFVCDYDHNAPTVEYLMKTHYAFYEIIREKQPDIPYIMVSRPDFQKHLYDSIKRREVVRTSYEKAREKGDKNVYFIDGETLLAGEYHMSCTVDGTHPNDLGFYRMADVIGKVLAEVMH